jgi:hypothetical protein
MSYQRKKPLPWEQGLEEVKECMESLKKGGSPLQPLQSYKFVEFLRQVLYYAASEEKNHAFAHVVQLMLVHLGVIPPRDVFGKLSLAANPEWVTLGVFASALYEPKTFGYQKVAKELLPDEADDDLLGATNAVRKAIEKVQKSPRLKEAAQIMKPRLPATSRHPVQAKGTAKSDHSARTAPKS